MPYVLVEAEQSGFIIEGEVGFLFDLGNGFGIVGYNTLDKTWQFDMSNEDLDVWQLQHPCLNVLLEQIEEIQAVCLAASKYNRTIDLVALVECINDGM